MAGFELVTAVSAHFKPPKKVRAGVAAHVKRVFGRAATVAPLFQGAWRLATSVAVGSKSLFGWGATPAPLV